MLAFLAKRSAEQGRKLMARNNPDTTPIEAPKTPVDALSPGRGGTPSEARGPGRTRVAQKAPTRASGQGAPKATKRVSGTKKVQRQAAAKQKRASAKQGALRIGSGTRAKQTTQRKSNKGGRASGP
jgi:hypothetical protein